MTALDPTAEAYEEELACLASEQTGTDQGTDQDMDDVPAELQSWRADDYDMFLDDDVYEHVADDSTIQT